MGKLETPTSCVLISAAESGYLGGSEIQPAATIWGGFPLSPIWLPLETPPALMYNQSDVIIERCAQVTPAASNEQLGSGGTDEDNRGCPGIWIAKHGDCPL
jgi:hypothetical protein